MSNESIFNSHVDYFLYLANWIKGHREELEISAYWSRLSNLLDIDIERYVSMKPEISLGQESQRMFGVKPDTLDSFVLKLNNTLWDIVVFRSGKDCPRCQDDELNYVLAEIPNTQKRKVILECFTCGLALELDGRRWSDGVAIIYPVNKDILEDYLLNLK